MVCLLSTNDCLCGMHTSVTSAKRFGLNMLNCVSVRSHMTLSLKNQLDTRESNMKPPSHSLLCECVQSSWEAIPIESVKESLSSCTITTSTHGSDNDKIHGIKPGQPSEEGRSVLSEEIETLFQGQVRLMMQKIIC